MAREGLKFDIPKALNRKPIPLKKYQAIVVPEEFKEEFETRCENDPQIANLTEEIEEIASTAERDLKREFRAKLDAIKKEYTEMAKAHREISIQLNRLKAKRNTARRKHYRIAEKRYIKAVREEIRKSHGLHQTTWADPASKRAIQASGNNPRGSDYADLKDM